MTQRWRERLTGYRDDGAAIPRRRHRYKTRVFLACPWCAGFWMSVLAYGAWLAAPTATLAVATVFAVSAAVALAAKHLDETGG